MFKLVTLIKNSGWEN